MNIPNLRSSYDQVGGLYHFGRMLDKIRLHATGKLPADYTANLGGGFDGRVCSFLHVKYEDLVAQAGSDEAMLRWCFAHGRQPTADEIAIFNDFLKKRGWNDSASDLLAERISQLDPRWAGKVHTFFDYIEVDEGRPPRTN